MFQLLLLVRIFFLLNITLHYTTFIYYQSPLSHYLEAIVTKIDNGNARRRCLRTHTVVRRTVERWTDVVKSGEPERPRAKRQYTWEIFFLHFDQIYNSQLLCPLLLKCFTQAIWTCVWESELSSQEPDERSEEEVKQSWLSSLSLIRVAIATH